MGHAGGPVTFYRALAIAASAILLSTEAWAQARSGAAACAEIISEAHVDCSQLAADKAKLSQLSGSDDDKAKSAV